MTSTVRLGDLGTTYGGLSGKTKADFGHGIGSFVTFLEVINNPRLRGRSLERVRVLKGERQNRVLRGDLLFNTSSETPADVALSAVVDFSPDRETFLNSFCFGYRLDSTGRADATFLAYYFRSDSGRALVSALAQGATRYNIAKTKFLNLELSLPSAEIQRWIAEALSDIDDLISALERLIAKKQAIKQGMMQRLLTGKARLPWFSDDWTDSHLVELGVFLKGRGVKRDDVRPAGVPCIRYGELYTAFVDYTSDTKSFVHEEIAATALPLQFGDLLFAGSGETRDDIGKCVAYVGESAAVAGGDIIVLRGSGFNPIYLATLLNTPEAAKQKARAGQGDAVVHVNSRGLGNVEISLPEKDEQDAIASVLVDADREIDSLRARLAKARAVKTGMMQELLTGRTRLPVGELAP